MLNIIKNKERLSLFSPNWRHRMTRKPKESIFQSLTESVGWSKFSLKSIELLGHFLEDLAFDELRSRFKCALNALTIATLDARMLDIPIIRSSTQGVGERTHHNEAC